MKQGYARAIAVGMADPDSRARLIEALAPLEIAGWAASAAEALALIPRLRPDLVVSDAILPGMDAPALAAATLRLKLNRYPDFLILRLPGLPMTWAERPERLGAAIIDKPVTPAGLAEALGVLAERSRPLPPEKAARLTALLDDLGVPEHPGRECLARAVTLSWLDRRRVHRLRDGLYGPVGAQLGLSAAQVERAMRHAIDAAWRTGAIEHQNRIFGDTIDARRGRPTCGEMIAQLADILRWEG